MEAHRLRAPSQDGGLLAEPPLRQAPERLAENLVQLEKWDHDFQGRRAGRLRAMARCQVLAKSREYMSRFGLDGPPCESPARLVVTGHQPELFHPGVWIKNFAAAGIARDNQATALNLIVDDDIPKGASIRVPEVVGDILRTRLIEFDDWAGELPYEDWNVREEGRFAGFPDRARETLGGHIPDPILDDFWPRALEARRVTDRAGLRFAAARRGLEADWGIHNAEVPLSSLCETEAFLWFASHLLAQLPRFLEIHNRSLDQYRRLYGIRSRHHPVPTLARDGEWLEAPFWVWRAAKPRRRPLLIRQKPLTMELRIAGEDHAFVEIPLGPDREACCAVDQLMQLPAHGIRLRTRALTTTMFARFILGDLFLHGIGGAKYDELGDEIARQFFGIAPPAFLTISMTLWLGLEDSPATADALHRVERALRDLRFNPDRYLNGQAPAPELQSAVAAKRAALAGPTATRRQRVARFYEIARCNEVLQSAVRPQREQLTTERTQILAGLRLNRIARGRDFAFVLHSRQRFQQAVASALSGANVV
jgi:hypothetical protein